MSDKINLPIGFMDSGLGGLSVLREAIKLMPHEDFIYYGDSLNAPYGTKDRDTIIRLTLDVTKRLLEYGIKGLTVACNTATGAAISILRNTYPDLPIVGIEPAIKPAVEASCGGRILVMATPLTIQQEKFRILLSRYENKASIIPVPCGGLMEFVEHGDLDSNMLDDYFKMHLLPYLSDDTEAIVLGCTHYPFIKSHLREFLGGRDIKLIDGSRGTALELKRLLGERRMLRSEDHLGTVRIENSMNNGKMIDLSVRLLSLSYE